MARQAHLVLLSVMLAIILCGSAFSHSFWLDTLPVDIEVEHLWTLGEDQDEFEIEFGHVQNMAVSPHGTLHVLDTDLNQIREYDIKANYVKAQKIPPGEGPGELHTPIDLTVDAQNRLHVLGRRERRIVTFSVTDGQYVGSRALSFTPTQITSTGDYLFVTSFWFSSDSTLYIVGESEGSERPILPRPDDWKDVAFTGNFERIAPTPEGTVLYSYPFPYRILEVDRQGTILRESEGHPSFDRPPEEENEVATMPEGSRGIALLASNHIVNLVLEEEGERVYLDLFSRDLEFIERVDLTEKLPAMPSPHLVAGPENTLFLSFSNPYPTVACYRIYVDE